MILLLLYRHNRKIERIRSRSSVPRARHCARRLTTSHDAAIRCRPEGGKRHPHQQQSPDIARGVNVCEDDLDVGAGDSDITFGYSNDETGDVTPPTSLTTHDNMYVYIQGVSSDRRGIFEQKCL